VRISISTAVPALRSTKPQNPHRKENTMKALDAAGLADMLTGERRAAESAAPDLAALAGLLVDTDGDGLDLGDIGKISGGLLGTLFKK
jgi:hypothetical protein